MTRSYELSGLQGAKEVSTSIFYGIVCVFVGIIIGKFSTTTDKDGKEETSSLILLSIGFYLLAFIFFMPLFAWIEFAALSIIGIAVVVGIIGLICIFVYNWIKG